MNNRFKFRVFNTMTNKYIQEENLYRFFINTDGKLYYLGDYNNIIEVKEDDFILEQCAGLEDRNGKLIYGGDIVIWNDGGGECELKPQNGWIRIAEVKLFPSLHFKIVGCYPKGTCEIGYEFHYGNFIYTDTEKYLKIVGNIHTNPELLEQNNDKR